MTNRKSIPLRLITILSFSLVGSELSLAATTISDTNKFAYGANTGWINVQGDSNNGARVECDFAADFIYSANYGWISLGDGTPTSGFQYSNLSADDFGVNHDGLGNLRGYAYGANIGWVQFEDVGDPSVDLVSGNMSGFAYSANVGWISLSNSQAFVETAPLANCTTDLSITKTSGPSPIAEGATATFTLTVTNRGPLLADNVVVSDSLPTEVTFVSVSSPDCVFTNGDVVCTFSNLAVGSSTTVTIDVSADVSNLATNTAVVTSFVSDSTPIDNTDSAVLDIRSAPIVSESTPTPESLNVALNQSNLVTFDQAMDPASINASNLIVYGEQHGPYSGTLIVTGMGTTVTFDPDSDYLPGERISMILTEGIQSVIGVPTGSGSFFALSRSGLGERTGRNRPRTPE